MSLGGKSFHSTPPPANPHGMGVFSNPANKPAQLVTACFCKAQHHLGTTKQKISKLLRGRNPDSTENNRWQAGQEYTPAKRLLGDGTQTPGKAPPPAAFSIAPDRVATRYRGRFQTQEVSLFPVGKATRIQRP